MPARLFISHPSHCCPTTHLLHQTKLSFFLFFFFFLFQLEPLQDNGVSLTCTQATPLPLSLTPNGTHALVPSPLCFQLTLHMHTPCHCPYHLAPVLDGFFFLFNFFILNSNHCRTMVATTSPLSPSYACRCPCLPAPTPQHQQTLGSTRLYSST